PPTFNNDCPISFWTGYVWFWFNVGHCGAHCESPKSHINIQPETRMPSGQQKKEHIACQYENKSLCRGFAPPRETLLEQMSLLETLVRKDLPDLKQKCPERKSQKKAQFTSIMREVNKKFFAIGEFVSSVQH